MKIALEELYKMRILILGISLLGFGLSFCIVGSLLPVVLGNLLGLLTAFGEMMMLGYATESALDKKGGNAVGGMVTGYFLRMAMIACVFYGTTRIETISTGSFVLPLFYPRLAIYFFAIKQKKGGE